ncbi:MAG TPA: DNA polymerase I [Candidatus Enterenecus stercoripullorum]|nr:DNA polymerase I [Candidatus Enterenecus stercoripullorum]
MKLMAIDGNSIVNRAFYGVSQNLSTRDGLPTNAIFGFLNILLKLLDEEKPDALAVAFDLKAPTFRHLAYEGYKAQRKGMPEELAAQMPVLKEVLDAMNIRRYELEGWEADDLLGTMSAQAEAQGWETVVVTGDKDSLQLIDAHVTVKLVSTRMGQTTTKDMTPQAFRAQYGFDPIHMIDLKALMGDASDNIPGVKGIGEKTAMALMAQYPDVKELYAHLDEVEAKPAVRKKLEEGQDAARMSYDLATIHRDAPMDFHPQDAARRPYNEQALYQILLRLEFSKLIDRLGLTGHGAVEQKENAHIGVCDSELVDSRERMEQLLVLWRGREHVSFLALPDLKGVCVEWGDEEGGRAAVLLEDKLDCYRDFLQGFFTPELKKVTHDCKPLMGQLLQEGLSLEGFGFDTAIAAYLLSPTDGSYELEKLAVSYFNMEVPKAQLYQAPDAFAPLADTTQPLGALMSHTALVEALYQEQKGKLRELGLERACYEIDLPLCAVLARMERVGFLVDREALARFGRLLTDGIQGEQDVIYALAGEEFNILSPKQLGHILFDKLGLPPVKKTKTGYSTSAEVLEKLAAHHEIVGHILEYRQLTKLNSTYVEGLSKVIAPDGRIHTSFQNTVTATGRLSSTEPNLQNIPVRTPLGAEMRTMFVAPAGRMLVDADYSQIELRLLAHISGDQALIAAFNEGVDIHTATAAQVFAVAPEDVTPDMRRAAKAVNFGIVYGISPFSLSQDIHVTVAQAKEYMDKYFAHYFGVRAYMDRVVEQGKADGYVATLYGRRRWLPELRSSNFNTRSFGERVALNMPIQGTAADIIKLAMLRVDQALREEGLEARLVLQVHDELIVECPEGETEQVKDLLKREMESVADLAVPLVAEAKAGKTWAQAH